MKTRSRRAVPGNENAPPALGPRTRSATHTTTTATLKSNLTRPGSTKPSIAHDPSIPSTTAMKSHAALPASKLPVMKRTATSATSGKATTSLPSRAALGEVKNASKKPVAESDKGKLEKKPIASGSSTAASAALRKARSTVKAEEEQPAAIKRKATSSSAVSRPAASRSRSTTASTVDAARPLTDKRVNVKQEKEVQQEPARKKRKTSSPAVQAVDRERDAEESADEGPYDAEGKEILLSSGSKVSMKSPKRLRAKDEGWEDLDAEDEGDPTMVAEYVVDAFNHMMAIEVSRVRCW